MSISFIIAWLQLWSCSLVDMERQHSLPPSPHPRDKLSLVSSFSLCCIPSYRRGKTWSGPKLNPVVSSLLGRWCVWTSNFLTIYPKQKWYTLFCGHGAKWKEPRLPVNVHIVNLYALNHTCQLQDLRAKQETRAPSNSCCSGSSSVSAPQHMSVNLLQVPL